MIIGAGKQCQMFNGNFAPTHGGHFRSFVAYPFVRSFSSVENWSSKRESTGSWSCFVTKTTRHARKYETHTHTLTHACISYILIRTHVEQDIFLLFFWHRSNLSNQVAISRIASRSVKVDSLRRRFRFFSWQLDEHRPDGEQLQRSRSSMSFKLPTGNNATTCLWLCSRCFRRKYGYQLLPAPTLHNDL